MWAQSKACVRSCCAWCGRLMITMGAKRVEEQGGACACSGVAAWQGTHRSLLVALVWCGARRGWHVCAVRYD